MSSCYAERGLSVCVGILASPLLTAFPVLTVLDGDSATFPRWAAALICVCLQGRHQHRGRGGD